jgi:hypothetical protein
MLLSGLASSTAYLPLGLPMLSVPASSPAERIPPGWPRPSVPASSPAACVSIGAEPAHEL